MSKTVKSPKVSKSQSKTKDSKSLLELDSPSISSEDKSLTTIKPPVQWKNTLDGVRIVPSPSDTLPKLIEQFGNPSFIDFTEGGIAVWKEKDLLKNWRLFSRIVLTDEFILNKELLEKVSKRYIIYNPSGSGIPSRNGVSDDLKEPEIDVVVNTKEINKEYYTFLQFHMKFFIPDNQLTDVLNISETIMYDRQKEELIVRSNNYPRALATLLLCAEVSKEDRTLEEIRENDLYRAYLTVVMDDTVGIQKQNDFLRRLTDYVDQGYVNYSELKVPRFLRKSPHDITEPRFDTSEVEAEDEE